MVLPTYAAICPVPAVKQAYFCRAAENMTLNYCLQQGVGLSSRWEKQPCCSQGWHIGRLNSSQQSCSESQFVPSPKVIVLFFKFMEEFIPCTFVICSFLALCMKCWEKNKDWLSSCGMVTENSYCCCGMKTMYLVLQRWDRKLQRASDLSVSQAPLWEAEPDWGVGAHQKNLLWAKEGRKKGDYQPFPNGECVQALPTQQKTSPFQPFSAFCFCSAFPSSLSLALGHWVILMWVFLN